MRRAIRLRSLQRRDLLSMTLIPVWKTSIASVAVIVAHLGTWFRISWLIVMLYLIAHGLMGLLVLDDATIIYEYFASFIAQDHGGNVDPEEIMAFAQQIEEPANRLTLVNLLSMVLTLVAASQLLVIWCRFVAMGDDVGGRWWVFRLGALELEMMGALVILGLGFSVAWVLAFTLSVFAVVALDAAGYVVMSIVFTGLFVLTIRLCLLIPQVACDGGLDPGKTWRRTEGNTWRIFSVALNLGFIGFVVMMLCLAVSGLVFYLSGGWTDLMAGTSKPQDVLTSPLVITLGVLSSLIVVAAHLVIVSMLGLIHAQLVQEETSAV